MRYLHPVAFVPNSLICDTTLHYTTKRVAVALLLLAGRKNVTITATTADLAAVSSCAPGTVQQAIRELTAAGYITVRRNYRHSRYLDHGVYAANSYEWQCRQGGYTMISRDILSYAVSPAAFCNLLYLYRCSGRKDRAFPSLRQIAGQLRRLSTHGLGMAKSTVCRVLRALRELTAIIRLHCKKRSKAFAANSYLLVNLVKTGCQEVFSFLGSPIFDKHRIIKPDNERLYFEEKKKGVAQFGGFTKIPEFSWGGKGWIVSAAEEQDWPF